MGQDRKRATNPSLWNDQEVESKLRFFFHSPGYKHFRDPTCNYIIKNKNVLLLPSEGVKE